MIKMRVLCAMSGGVDSSVAAALLLAAGHEVTGVTMKLWGGAQDSGCCSVSDVDDARRVAQQLRIDHHVFNFTDDFEARVVTPYVEAHGRGQTPNPCVECNRHLKFDRLLTRADALGFDRVATGHHARVVFDSGRWHLRRAADRAKDQSYVLHMLGQDQLAKVMFPVGSLQKAEVRAHAARLALRTATKPDSQDTCFITATGGREAFLRARMALHPGTIVDADSGVSLGQVDAVELVTVGQRRGLDISGPQRRYAVRVDVAASTITVGRRQQLLCDSLAVDDLHWVDAPVSAGTPVLVQTSAHGAAQSGVWGGNGVVWSDAQRRVAPGQAVVLYDANAAGELLGGGTAA